MNETIPIAWAGCTSEWGLLKFRDALQDPLISKLFSLSSVAGRKDTARQTADAIREKFPGKQDILNFAQTIENGTVPYFSYPTTNNGQTIIPESMLHGSNSAVYISSNNVSHVTHISNGLEALTHTLIEKPPVVVVNLDGEASPRQIEELERILRSKPGHIVLMDAEHYAYKQPSLIFYKERDTILNGRKIIEVDGRIIETDVPTKCRNIKLLGQEERTGLFTDTGVHLLSFITNLGGRAVPQNAFYSFYPGYPTETSTEVEYKIEPDKNSPFAENAPAFFRVEKFTDRKRIPGKEDKKITFHLNDGNRIELIFGKPGEVTEITKDGQRKPIHSTAIYSANEYVNILNEFYNAITTRTPPLTPGENSLRTMRVIYETYLKCPPRNSAHRRNIYVSS